MKILFPGFWINYSEPTANFREHELTWKEGERQLRIRSCAGHLVCFVFAVCTEDEFRKIVWLFFLTSIKK